MIPPQGNADFAAAMEKVLDVYRRPYDAAFPVVRMDETPRELIRETRVPIPRSPGQSARHDYKYARCGTCNIFLAAEPLAGKRMTKVTERKTKIDWAQFLDDIAARYEDATRITLVMDNLNTTPDALHEVTAWQAVRGSIQAKVDWQFTADDARVKLKCLYPTPHG